MFSWKGCGRDHTIHLSEILSASFCTSILPVASSSCGLPLLTHLGLALIIYNLLA